MAFNRNKIRKNHNKKFDPEKYLKQKKAENSTPWSKFKNEILENENVTATKYSNKKLDENTRREMDEQRRQNHKKFLIETKKTESTIWEDFSTTPDPETKKIQKEKKKELKKTREEFKRKNYDPNNLTTENRNSIRKCITSLTLHQKGGSLEQAVGAMKRRGIFKKKNPFK